MKIEDWVQMEDNLSLSLLKIEDWVQMEDNLSLSLLKIEDWVQMKDKSMCLLLLLFMVDLEWHLFKIIEERNIYLFALWGQARARHGYFILKIKRDIHWLVLIIIL